VPDYGQTLQFGVFITPTAADAGQVLALSQLADTLGLDILSFQDHPYQARFMDTWTLLSHVAAQTSNVQLAPNVANLPLRQPAVLAKSVATLDILSGGRAQLGLGSGAFWDGIAALGGRKLTPGQGVDALTEALDVIRAMWSGERSATVEGEHYSLTGAHPGPPPVHDVEIWLGAYKPRMLALTGARADGWIPSMGYADRPALGELNERIDEAAHEAGRHPSQIRRLYNVNGGFGGGAGFLEGSPAAWAEQLTELTMEQGMSTYILSVQDDATLRRFADEVAPAVRELVDRERGRHAAGEEAAPPAPVATGSGATPFAVTPTEDDGTRVAAEPVWDESTRPEGPSPSPDARYTPDQQAAGRHLIDVHDGLRAELDRLRQMVTQLAAGSVDPTTVRSFLNRMTIRQNNWTLGVYCMSYCRVVTGHHTLEDQSVFPHLRSRDPGLTAVIDRLQEEHEVIADLLERIDAAIVGLVSSEGIEDVQASVDALTDAMVSHLSYEERELVEPLARHGFA